MARSSRLLPPRDTLLALQTAELTHEARCRLVTAWPAWRAASGSAAPTPGINKASVDLARAISANAPVLARQVEATASRRGDRLLCLGEADYPAELARLELPPAVLTLVGELPPAPRVAIVGPRHADPYGLEVTRTFAHAVAETGITIVSGFARGVDATAHRSALDVGAPTIAVLGCGIDVDYPRHGGTLRRDIERNGTLLTEFPYQMPPQAHHFPVRNRLIAALAEVVLVVQATRRSGSLITARLALEQGRDVFAVPGRIVDRRSQGTNELLRDGAGVALEPRDVLDALARLMARAQPQAYDGPSPSPAEVAPSPVDPLLENLAGGELSLDELYAALGGSLADLQQRLLMLELDGRVEKTPIGLFRRRT